jgi:hypothetical protein
MFFRRASAWSSDRSFSEIRTVMRVPFGSFDFPTIGDSESGATG